MEALALDRLGDEIAELSAHLDAGTSRPTRWAYWPRQRSTTGSTRAPPASTIRSSSTSTPRCWRIPISPASPSSKAAHAFPRNPSCGSRHSPSL
jgi:hypothetical protein